uniref:Capsid protein n=1 Tax=Psittacidae parvoviridae sp. TaxID=2794536 RepID=A0A8A4XD98_9VIRU|nr:MAG: capsid protein [Psittacidae parvoviridae sp.]
MAESHTFTNVYCVYLKNQPYVYPSDATPDQFTANKINTGWHCIPNMLWKHFVSPKQWYEFQLKYQAYHVESMECTIFNMIPMTTQLAIQNTSIFTAFNNTVYAWGYTDTEYETSWESWASTENTINNLETYCPNLAWKEGLNKTLASNDANKLNTWPIYLWRVPHVLTTSKQTWANSHTGNSGDGVWACGNEGNCWPSGVFWDPLNNPDSLQELRPGKNAIRFTWNCHPTDENVWFNMDQLASWWPWTPSGPYSVNTRPGQIKLSSDCDPELLATYGQSGLTKTGNSYNLGNPNTTPVNDYTIPNWSRLPIVPASWWWKELKQQIAQTMSMEKIDFWFNGTEYEQYKYPPHQWFTKIVPLFDTNGTHIEVQAQCSVKISLTVKAKPRKSAIYAPTWGPFSWRNVYSAQTSCINFQPSMVRYRTAGARRTWQNIAQNDGQQWAETGHPREDPYINPSQANATVAAGSGIASTSYTTTTAPIREHIQPDTKTPVMHTTPIAPKRRAQREKTQSPPLPIKDLTFFPHLTDTQL